MVSMLRSCNSGKRKVKAGQLVVSISTLCIIIALSVIQRSSIRKHDMLKHSQSCECIYENQDTNLLHAIPLLLFPALQMPDSEPLSLTNQQNCFAPVKSKRNLTSAPQRAVSFYSNIPNLEAAFTTTQTQQLHVQKLS